MAFKMSYGETPAPVVVKAAPKPAPKKPATPRRAKTATLQAQAEALFDPPPATPATSDEDHATDPALSAEKPD